ncbi:MAG: hypothetical protein LBG97_08005 [Coriobacteriales bacterium]|jgi:CRISPR-associated protein Csx10|nr:hypothetical protein [Coriobacteriales bacterium]
MKYLSYSIKTIQPLVINEISSKAKTQRTLDYIPGSSMRGEFIRLLLKTKDAHRLNEVLDEVVFSNAYLKDCIPMPRSFQADKHKLRNNDVSKVINTLNFNFNEQVAKNKDEAAEQSDTEQNEALANKYPYLKLDQGVVAKQNVLCKVTKSTNRRISLNALGGADAQESTIFYTEAIDANHSFHGYIQFEESLSDVIKSVCKTFRYPSFGAAQNSGYGGCEISFSEITNEAPNNVEHANPNDELFIYCASDVISYNADGKCMAKIDAQLLEDRLGISGVKHCKSVLTQKTVSGYNKKMRASYPCETAIAAGSVFKYEYSGTLDSKRVLELEVMGVGKRRSEGFGKIIINPIFLTQEELLLAGIAPVSSEQRENASTASEQKGIAPTASELKGIASTASEQKENTQEGATK